LFPALEAAGIPREHGPLGVMLAEHELGRTFVRRMTEAFDALVRGDQKARDRFVYNARGYANLLRMHIQKENEVLFPMAEHVLSEAEQTRLGGEFDQVEEVEVGQGVHEAFHEMLNELRDIYTPA
jgi:hemerythrin-like domain-containing protein